LQDLESLWQFMELNPRRTAVLGHSFGGLIALRFAETRGSKFSALTLMSPLLRLTVEVDRFTLVLGKLMSWIAPTTRFKSRVSAEHTCRSPEVLARREQDPLIHRSITARWFFEMQDAIADGWSDADSLTMPVLALQAGDDKIVDPLAVEPWLLSTHSSDRTFHSLPGHYHELLNEPDWETTGQTVLEWLDARVRSLAVAR
jgi:lysophospholipase